MILCGDPQRQCYPIMEEFISATAAFIHKGFKAVLFLVLFYSFHANGQQTLGNNDNPSFPKVIPPSPNAASLGKYGEVPVSLYTGIPNISVPLYEVKSGSLSIPISLSYNAGGIRVEEIASWVGLGWSLNAGGVVTRTVRGSADGLYNNYKTTIDYLFNSSTTLTERESMFSAVISGTADTEPDIFHFNFPGGSGKFFIGEDGVTCHIVPRQMIDIKFAKEGRDIVRWIITDQNGVQYTFGTNANRTKSAIEYNETSSVSLPTTNVSTAEKLASSWFLIEVKSPANDIITFDYTPYSYNFKNLGSETSYYLDPSSNVNCAPRTNKNYVRNYISGQRLERITFSNGKVEFNVQASDRTDLDGDYALEYIRVYETTSSPTVRKYFKLSYDYFVALYSSPSDQYGTRLKLTAVTEYGSDNQPKPAHLFYYDEANPMPPRLTDNTVTNPICYAQDHWGYYNGKLNNRKEVVGEPTLIPTFFLDFGFGHGNQEFKGADRNTSEAHAKAYSLTSIKYPTGGVTSFEYESNTVPSSSYFPNSYLLSPQSRFSPPAILNSGPGNVGSYVEKTFTVNSLISEGGQLGSFATITFFDYPGTGAGKCTVEDPAVDRLLASVGGGSINITNPPNNHRVFLPNGTYRVRVTRRPNYTCTSSFYMNVSWVDYQLPAEQNFAVGGLRVKRIVDYDGVNHAFDVVRNFKYHSLLDVTKSSGSMLNYPNYGWESYFEGFNNINCYYAIRQSFGNYPLATTSGGYVGYGNVTVEYGDGTGNGKTEYTYAKPSGYPVPGTFPFAPTLNDEWKYGQLLSEVTYAKTTSGPQKIIEKNNYYTYYLSSLDPLYTSASGLKLGVQARTEGGNTLRYQWYKTITGWYKLDSTVTTNYHQGDPSKYLRDREHLEYGLNHLQVVKRKVQTSSGWKTEHLKYPLDFEGLSASSARGKGILMLRNQHIITPVIESYVTETTGASAPVVTSATFNSYQPNLSLPSQVVQDTTFVWESQIPLPLTGTTRFSPSSVVSGNIQRDPLYKFKIRSFYDARSRIKQVQQADNIPISYHWGYSQSFPVAQVYNARNDGYVISVQSTGSQGLTLGGVPGFETTWVVNVEYTGPVKIKLGVSSQSFVTNLMYSGDLGSGSIALTNNGGCGYNVVTLNNVSPGLYTLKLSLTTATAGISSLGACGQIEYPKYTLTGAANGVTESYFQGFEDGVPGQNGVVENASVAHTGKRYFGGTAYHVVSFTRPNTREYVIEYWYRNASNQWVFISKPYTGPTMTLNESMTIDDIRIRPKDAPMKSFAYDPLFGVTAVMDENGRLTYYKYDTQGRLYSVKDDNGHLTNVVEYNYKK